MIDSNDRMPGRSFVFRRIVALTMAAAFIPSVAPTLAQDSAAAERQYKVARRLAAEDSPQAREALRKVVELDPSGPLADDALVDEALLIPLPRWPEDLGRVSKSQAALAMAPLTRVAELFTSSDRNFEATYYHSLLQLEPHPGRKANAARVALLALATDGVASEWSRAARYTLAWLSQQQGDRTAAAAGFQRLLVDAPESRAAARSRVALARIALRDQQPGQAASLLQRAMEGRVDPSTGAPALRELAVRLLMGNESTKTLLENLKPVVSTTGVRSAVGISTLPDLGLLIGDDRSDAVVALGPDGAVLGRWELPDLAMVVSSRQGNSYAADSRRIYRLDPGRPAVEIASQGDFEPIGALTVDDGGTLFVLDRKGERLGRIDPGASSPVTVWKKDGGRHTGLVWDGSRLITLDTRTKSLRALDRGGSDQPISSPVWTRPTGLAADPAGRIAVLDTRAGSLTMLLADGEVLGTVGYRNAGVEKPEALAFGLDGSLHLFDAANGAWVLLP